MEKDLEGKREEALAFLIGHETGVLATASMLGESHARLVYYTCDDAFNVYFLTLKNTRKVSDLAANPRAAFVVSEAEVPRTLQMEGVVDDLTDTATIDPLVSDFIKRLMSHTKFGIPLARFDSSAVRFYRIKPTWLRWGDFTFGDSTESVLTKLHPQE